MNTINLFAQIFSIETEGENVQLLNENNAMYSLDDADKGLPIALMLLHHFSMSLYGNSPIYMDFSVNDSCLFGLKVNFEDHALLYTNDFQQLITETRDKIALEPWFKKCTTNEEKILTIQSKCADFFDKKIERSKEIGLTLEKEELNGYLKSFTKTTLLVTDTLLDESHSNSGVFVGKPFEINPLRKKYFPEPLKRQDVSEYLSELKKQGDESLNQLFKQIEFVTAAQWLLETKTNLKSEIKEIPGRVSKLTFLCSLLGTPEVLSIFARYFDCSPSEIKFPEAVYKLRSELNDSFEERTFDSGASQSVNWFSKIESIPNQSQFDLSLVNVISALLGRDKSRYGFSDNLIENFAAHWNLPFDNKDKTPLITEFFLVNSDIAIDIYFDAKKELNNKLALSVVGQQQAKKALLDSVTLYNTTESSPVFTFLGKSGVGKTSLAETFAENYGKLFATGHKPYIVNCENYSDKRDASRLFGSGQQYADSFLGELTSLVALYPRQVLIFDEIEKAHSSVHRSLLTLLSKRKTKDYTTGRWVDFSQCIFIFTTNLGSDKVDEINDSAHEFDITMLLSQNLNNKSPIGLIADNLYLPPEFVNRLASGHIVPFSSLNEWDTATLLTSITAEICKQNDWSFTHFAQADDYQLADILINTYSGDFSPRSIRSHKNKLFSRIHSYLNDEEGVVIPIKKLTKRGFNFEPTSCLLIKNNADEVTNLLGESLKKSYHLSHVSEQNLLSMDSSLEKLKQYDLVLIAPDSHDIETLDNLLCKLERENTNKIVRLEKYDPVTIRHYLTVFPIYKKLKLSGMRAQKAEYSFKLIDDDDTEGVTIEVAIGKVQPALTPDLANLPFVTLAKKTNIQLDDVVGMKTAKQTLLHVLSMLQYQHNINNQPLSKGALLHGKPGTGKTFLVQALANEIDIPLVIVNSSDVTIGDSEKNIDSLFHALRQNAPCAVFFDEFDAIAPVRVQGQQRFNILVNKLLTAINGFENESRPIYIIAATNSLESIDPAITRPGRIDQIIECDIPTHDELVNYLERLSEQHNFKFSHSQLNSIRVNATGQTVPEITNAFNDAAVAGKHNCYREVQLNLSKINKETLLRPAFCDEETEKVKAYHEAGHLLAAKLLMPDIEVCSCSIVANENSGGWTQLNKPYRVKQSPNIQSLYNDVQVLLAGRAAEQLWFGEISLGSKTDIQIATTLLKKAYESGSLTDDEWLIDHTQFHSSEIELKHQVNNCLKSQYEKVLKLLTAQEAMLKSIAELLVENKVIFHEDVELLFSSAHKKVDVQNVFH